MSHCWRKTSSPEFINSEDLSAKGTGRAAGFIITLCFILFITSTYIFHLNREIRTHLSLVMTDYSAIGSLFSLEIAQQPL